MTENGENRLRAKERFVEATKHIDIISIIDKKRWQWLGHALRMEPNRNPHKALKLLDFKPGSLLSHLPSMYHVSPLSDIVLLAKDRKKWKEYLDSRLDFVSLNMLCPLG